MGLVDTVGDMLGGRVHRGLADRGWEVRKDSLGLAGTGLPAYRDEVASHTSAGDKARSLVQDTGPDPFAHIAMAHFAWEGWG